MRARPLQTNICIQSSTRWNRWLRETGKRIPQIALNWVLQRPTVSSIILGARNEEQFRQNLDAVGWNLSADRSLALDKASAR